MAVLRRLALVLRRLAAAGALGVAALGAVLAREGMSAGEWVLVALLVAAPAIVLVFAQGVAEVAALPDRLRRAPDDARDRLGELGRLAGELSAARLRRLPLLLWRLRGSLGGLRDLAGVALPLRVFVPGFVVLTALAAAVCVAAAVAGLAALLVLAAG